MSPLWHHLFMCQYMHTRLQPLIRCFEHYSFFFFKLYTVSKSKNGQSKEHHIHTKPLVLLTPEQGLTTEILSILPVP